MALRNFGGRFRIFMSDSMELASMEVKIRQWTKDTTSIEPQTKLKLTGISVNFQEA